MKTVTAACLAALLLASCGSGPGRTAAPAQEGAAGPVPAGQAAPSDPEANMEPDELALVHIAQVINILRDLMYDCTGAERKSMAYIERNKDAIVSGVAYGKSKEKALKGQAKDAYEDKMEALLNELAPDFDKVLDGFDNVCPNQKEAIGSAMGL